MKKKVLIIGGSSKVGKNLINTLDKNHIKFIQHLITI